MPRASRQFAEGQALHLVQRGNNRGTCFADDADRTVYLGMLATIAADTRCDLHAYVLMTNHVHLLITPATCTAPSKLMQRTAMRYAAFVNRKYGRSGTLWEGRFRACAIATDEYVIACHRYIELNPVRAQMAARAEDYRWSSHRANIGRIPPGFLRMHPSIAALGPRLDAAVRAYRSLFDAPLDGAVLAELREGVRRRTPMTSPGSDSNLTPGVAGQPATVN